MYGNCYTFNSGANDTIAVSQKSGPHYGMCNIDSIALFVKYLIADYTLKYISLNFVFEIFITYTCVLFCEQALIIPPDKRPYIPFSSGLVMTIFVDQSEYVPSLSSSAGIRLLIHRQYQQPFPEDEGMEVGPGQLTSIKVRMVRYHIMSLRVIHNIYGSM